MIYSQAEKVVASEPLSYTNGSTASVVIDRLNFDYANIDIILGRVNSTNAVPTSVVLQESDTTTATTFTNVPGGTSLVQTNANFTNGVLAAALTSGVQVVQFSVDCRNRKRYLQPAVVPSTTQIIAIDAHLSRGKQEPVEPGDLNLQLQVIG